MASAERKPIMGVWGLCPHRGPGAWPVAPLWIRPWDRAVCRTYGLALTTIINWEATMLVAYSTLRFVYRAELS